MNYTRLGRSGLTGSRICLGMMSFGDPALRAWTLPLSEVEPLVKQALDGASTSTRQSKKPWRH